MEWAVMIVVAWLAMSAIAGLFIGKAFSDATRCIFCDVPMSDWETIPCKEARHV